MTIYLMYYFHFHHAFDWKEKEQLTKFFFMNLSKPSVE